MPYQNPYALGLLMSDGSVVDFASAVAPSANQVLTATGPSSAAWGTPSGGANPSVLDAKTSGSTTTTSATDVLLPVMSLTPGAGNYVLWFVCSAFDSNSSAVISFSVYVNGAQVAGTLQSIRVPAVNGSVIASVMTYLTGVLAGQAVEIRWNNGSTGTATATNREMVLMKVT